jgi:hypothetical protein
MYEIPLTTTSTTLQSTKLNKKKSIEEATSKIMYQKKNKKM